MPTRRGNFFLELVYLKVENKVHAVPRRHLKDCSRYFAEKFQELFPQDDSDSDEESDESRPATPGLELPVPAPSARDRIGTEGNPLPLEDCTNAEFESLLYVIVAPSPLQVGRSREEWLSVLKLATMWKMPETKAVAISKLASTGLSVYERIGLGIRFQVAEWLVDSVTPFVSGEELNVDALSELVGWEVTARIAYNFRKPHASKIVNVHPNDWKCPFCKRRMWKGTYPWERPRKKDTHLKCATCGKDVSMQDGAGKMRDIRIDVAEFYDQPTTGSGLADLREVMADGWVDSE